MSQPLHFQTARELAARLRAREISAGELLDQAIARIEALDGRLNAVVARDFERARERARAADAELAAGRTEGKPLLGLPVTIKDAFETEGLVTACGAPELAGHVPAASADAVQRYVDAGALVIGKTNVPLYAGDGQTFNSVYGTTNNPWDPARSPAGSSGGAAAALAAGFTPLEIGSDIGGSIRNPSHACGVFGHKPTWGIVSDRGHIPGPPGQLAETDLNVVGPMARSAEDLALGLSLLAGPRPTNERGGWRLELPAPRATSPSGLRVAAWLDDPFSPVEAECRTLLEGAAAELERSGAKVDRAARPEIDFARAYETYLQLLTPIIAAGFPRSVIDLMTAASAELSADDQSDVARQIRGSLLSHREWIGCDEARQRMAIAWRRFFDDFDLVLMPVHPTTALLHDHRPNFHERRMTVNGEERPYLDFLHWVSLPTLVGLPSTVAPVGRTAAGLPVGIQIVGARFEDRSTLEAASWLGEFVPPPDYA
ncbi:MAG TPA: amidase [Myxococcota bacterium]|nr:amidase [Myxococcota bacterium]